MNRGLLTSEEVAALLTGLCQQELDPGAALESAPELTGPPKAGDPGPRRLPRFHKISHWWAVVTASPWLRF